jgi:hypothetical protein
MTKILRNGLCALLLLGPSTACAPLTFSEPPAVDFERYPSVRVEVVPSFTDPTYATQYLADELARSSGFAYVTTSPAQLVELVLQVQVAVSSDLDSDGELHYEAEAEYVASTPRGVLVAEGSEDDTSASPTEAVEDALDQVALRFIHPYRL